MNIAVSIGTFHRAGRLRGNRRFGSVPESRVPAAPHARNAEKPQECHHQKRQKIQQKIPTAKPRWSHFYLGCFLSTALRTLNHKAHVPQLLLIKISLSVVLRLPAGFHAPGIVKLLGKPSSYGLNTDLNFQIVRKRTARRRFHEHVKRSGADVRMRPKSNYTGPNFLVLNNGKWGSVVCAGWRKQQQQEHNQKPDRNYSRTRGAIQHSQYTNGYPLIIVARISMG